MTEAHNDETGASAYDPRVMLKIVLLAYSRGLISSRRIEHACLHHVQFIALSGDSQPSYTHIAKLVRELGPQIKTLFTEVLLTCDRMGLIGRQIFAIDGVKLPANASKERSGTHAELLHRAARLDQAAAKIIALHQTQDDASQELKTNITDSDRAKMATSKGVIQGYAAQAAVDSAHQQLYLPGWTTPVQQRQPLYGQRTGSPQVHRRQAKLRALPTARPLSA